MACTTYKPQVVFFVGVFNYLINQNIRTEMTPRTKEPDSIVFYCILENPALKVLIDE